MTALDDRKGPYLGSRVLLRELAFKSHTPDLGKARGPAGPVGTEGLPLRTAETWSRDRSAHHPSGQPPSRKASSPTATPSPAAGPPDSEDHLGTS